MIFLNIRAKGRYLCGFQQNTLLCQCNQTAKEVSTSVVQHSASYFAKPFLHIIIAFEQDYEIKWNYLDGFMIVMDYDENDFIEKL